FDLLERCSRKFKDDPRYKDDIRYLRVWTAYVSSSRISMGLVIVLCTAGSDTR
ncbi:unnamed protein product, partial [Ectocarpus sp. 13 AM-2016]